MAPSLAHSQLSTRWNHKWALCKLSNLPMHLLPIHKGSIEYCTVIALMMLWLMWYCPSHFKFSLKLSWCKAIKHHINGWTLLHPMKFCIMRQFVLYSSIKNWHTWISLLLPTLTTLEALGCLTCSSTVFWVYRYEAFSRKLKFKEAI